MHKILQLLLCGNNQSCKMYTIKQFLPYLALVLVANYGQSENLTFDNVVVNFTINTLPVMTETRRISSKTLKGNVLTIPPGHYLSATIIGTVKTLYEDSIADMDFLREVFLTGVKLEEIHPGALKNLTQLRTLYLNNNKLKEIQTGTFDNLDVVYLDLSNNRISSIQQGAFQNLREVGVLDLSTNQLTTLAKGIFKNCKIESLLVNINRITTIEPGFFQDLLPTPNFVFIAGKNNLEAIDPSVFKSADMKILNLNKNLISDLRPGDLANVPSLETLSVAHNNLEKIRKGVFGSNIERLDLANNDISEIESDAFQNVKNLSYLLLPRNQLTEWDPKWLRGKTVQYLNMAANKIECIEGDLDDVFKNTEIVDLDGNPYTPSCLNKIENFKKKRINT